MAEFSVLAAAKCPIVGVLCIDVAQKLSSIYGPQVKSYIAASYVKWLEGAGAQVVPIWIGKSKQYYADIMQKINGILLPGGAVFFDAKYATSELRNDCVCSSKFIYEIAVEKNMTGNYFPIWGTCLGIELLLLHSAEGVDPRQDCEHMDYALPVVFERNIRESKLFAALNSELQDIMQSVPFGYHFHRYCITKDDLKQFKIHHLWHVLATNKDANGLEFISILEHKQLPFYGTQFHPERVRYEQSGELDRCCHAPTAIRAAQYFADFFVNECRKCNNCFVNDDEKLQHLIWNFEVKYTGLYQAHWLQCYLFDDAPEYPYKDI